MHYWFVPLLGTIPFVIWELTDFGLSQIELFIICIPFFIAIMLLLFPFMRPWFITIITLTLGFELWAFGIGYWIQETKLQKLCTGRTIATVLSLVLK